MPPCRRAAFILLAVFSLVAFCVNSSAERLVGFNLIGTNSSDSHFALGPGIAAFETVAAPQGNTALYQIRLAAVEWLQPTNASLRSVSAVLFGSQNVENQLTPAALPAIPGEMICDVWTNGLAGLYRKPQQPDIEFDAGSTADLTELGSITNSANGTNYPIFLARADFAGRTNFLLKAGLKYAASLRIRYAAVTAVTTRVCATSNTNGVGGLTRVIASGYWDSQAETNSGVVPLPAYAVEFDDIPAPGLAFQCLPAMAFRLSLRNDPFPYTFLRFESATNLKAPINWSAISGIGNPPSATGALSGHQMFFRSVFK